MRPGDFIITPSWTFHDHGNPGKDPVVWLDGLDIPIVAFFDAGFAERYPDEVQPVVKPEGDALARYGANLLPIDHALGILAAQRRHFTDADALLERALAVDPRAVDALANRSNVQNALGHFAGALANADSALRIDPAHVGALYNQGLALQRQNRLGDAISSYDKALAIAPNFAEALVNRGAALLDLYRDDEALTSFDRALAVRPGHAGCGRAGGRTRKGPRRLREADIDDLIADRDAHAKGFALPFAPEYPEGQILQRKVAAGIVRRNDPALQRGIVRLVQVRHVAPLVSDLHRDDASVSGRGSSLSFQRRCGSKCFSSPCQH